MNKEKLENNLVLKMFKERFGDVKPQLVGGAVIDILEDRVPKDYDFIFSETLKKKLDEISEFKYVSKTSFTYEYNGFLLQLLRKNKCNFPFTIEKSQYCINSGTITTLDMASFNNKTLIPTAMIGGFVDGYCEVKSAREALLRIPHWVRKGYKINDITYFSLINIVTKQNSIGVNS